MVSRDGGKLGTKTRLFLCVPFEASLHNRPRILRLGSDFIFLEVMILNHLDTRFAILLHVVFVIYLGCHVGQAEADTLFRFVA